MMNIVIFNIGPIDYIKVRLENDWNSKANDFLVLVRRSFFSAEDDSEQLRHANENKTKINYWVSDYQIAF